MRLFDVETRFAALAAMLALLNQTLLIQSRIAMLDIHFIGYFSLSVLALIWAAKRRRSKSGTTLGLVISGVFLGLSTASKIPGGMSMMLLWCGILIWRFREASPRGWVLPRLFGSGFAGWNKLSFAGAGLRQGVPAILVYLLCYLPFYFMDGDWTLLSVHKEMLNAGTAHLTAHPYSSEWWEWPLMIEPIWYHFTDAPDTNNLGLKEAIFYVGNPVVYWGGLLTIFACIYHGFRREDGVMLAISCAYFAFLLLYAVLPRTMFFAYYYELAALMLPMSMAVFVERIISQPQRNLVAVVTAVSTAGMFIYFYPALVALPFKEGDWTKWLWLPFWA
jgi:dolichyl-phosphate-mannose--protein O-mannosyl transferase